MTLRRRDLTVVLNWRDQSHPAAGGAELYCEEVARRLAAGGREVVLVTAAVDGAPASESRDGYRIVRRGGTLGVYPAALLWLLRRRRHIAAVIDSQNGIPFYSPLVVRRRVPVVLLMHHVHQDQFTTYFPPVAARLGRWLEGPVTRRVYGDRAIAAVSPSTRRAVRIRLRLGGPISVAPPGCRLPSRPGRNPEERSTSPRIVCLGRMVRHKRVHLAIEAMRSVLDQDPSAELHLIGDGPERLVLESLAAGIGGDRIVFHGALSDAGRDEVIRSAWLGVNPSQGEGWAISVLDINALGVPVVGFRVPGLRDSIQDGRTGWLVDESDDLGARLAAYLDVLRDPEWAASLASQSVAWATRASWDLTSDTLADLMQAERGRLMQSDRRSRTDLASHLFLPSTLIPPGAPVTFRLTDHSVRHERGLSAVLHGADADDVRIAMRRAGLPPAVVHSPRIVIRIARPADLVDPAASDRIRTESESDRRVIADTGRRVDAAQ